MKCPFCTESIHPNAKFCPKCGLPLKDDATVMGGAYVSDDGGPTPMMIAAGAGGLVVVALLIGWLTGQSGKKPQEQVRREPVRMSPTAGVSGLRTPGVPGASYATFSAPAPVMQTFRSSGAGPAFDTRPNVRWAWNPPSLPPVTAAVPGPVADWQVAPVAPPNMGQLKAMITRSERQQAPRLMAAVPTQVATPPIPDWLADAGQNVTFFDPTAAANAAEVKDVEGGPFSRVAPIENPRSAYTYDAYQDQWVINPERVSSRTLNRMGRGNRGGTPARSGGGNSPATPSFGAPSPTAPPSGFGQ